MIDKYGADRTLVYTSDSPRKIFNGQIQGLHQQINFCKEFGI